MKSYILLLTLLALAACANKNDPGLGKPNAAFTVKDSLKGKTPAEVLKLKYSKAIAVCKLDRVAAQSEKVKDFSLLVAGDKKDELILDLKAWSEGDPQFSPWKGDVWVAGAKNSIGVALTLKFEIISTSLKMGEKVYLMKYAPKISFDFTTALPTDPVTGLSFMVERAPFSTNVATSEGFNYVLSCTIDTELMKESENFAEYEAQFQTINCTSPNENQKAIALDLCKN